MSVAPLDAAAGTATMVAGSELTRPQKVAAVMLALGAEVAERLLARLPDADVERVAQEVVTLGELSPDQLAEVLDDFYTEARAHRFIVTGGEHHARELLRSWRGEQADDIVDRLVAAAEQTPFSFLNLVPTDEVARVLCEEHPQTAAVVLAHLPTALGAEILAAIPDDVRSAIAVRIATREPCPPEVIERIEANLRIRLADQVGPVARPQHASGLRELANMLNSTQDGIGSDILAAIEERDEALAKEIRSQMFVFADLATLSDRDLQEVLRTIDGAQLALALKGLEGDLRGRLEGNLSERARLDLAEEMELLGATRAAEIEVARAEIAAQVRTLVEEGTVTVIRADAEDVVA